MKNISPFKSKRKKIITLTAILLVVFAGIFLYFILRPDPTVNTPATNIDTETMEINYDEATDEQIEAGNEIKKQTVDSFDEQQSSTQDTPEIPSTFSTQLTTATVQADILYVRNEIEGIHTEGTCKLTLTKNSSVVTLSSGLQALPKSSTCKGFNVPVSDLSPGVWSIKIEVTINSQTSIATGEVTV